MGKNSVVKNYIYNLVYQILTLILPLVTTPYVSRVLGADGVGTYSFTISVVTYFILFGSLGMSLYGQRQVAFVQEDIEKRSAVFFETLILRFITLGISIALFVLAFAVKGEYSLYYRILLLHIIASAFDISYFFQGLEEFKKVVIRNIAIKLISIVCIFIFVKGQNDIGVYLFIYSLSNLIGNASLWLYLPRYIKLPNIKKLNIFSHIRPVLAVFIPQIATQIYTVLDKVMLGSLLTDKSAVGYYEQSQKIILVILTIVTSLGTVMMPNMANKFANNNSSQITKALYTSFRFVFFLALPMVFGMLAISADLLPAFLGEGFEGAIYVTYVISPIILLVGLSNVIGIQYLLPTMRQTQYTVSVTVGAIVNLICNFIFIPHLQSVGAALGTLIAETAVTAIQFIFVRKDFSIKKILLMGIKYLIGSALMLVAVMILNSMVLSQTSVIVRIIIDIVVGMLVYLLYLAVIKDEFLYNIFKRVRGIIK